MKAYKLFSIFVVSLFFSFSTYAQEIKSNYELEIINDIDYYEGATVTSPEAQLNIIKPLGIKRSPVLLWIGQGAWAYVDRNKEMDICKKIAVKGITVISVGHRLSPQLLGKERKEEGVKHPAHVKDIAKAFKWVYDNSDKYGYDKGNIFVGGYSSGAHLAALLASDEKYLKELGSSNEFIKGIIPIAGTYDIPHYRELLMDEDPTYEYNHIEPVFGDNIDEHLDASPSQFIRTLRTNILLISEKESYIYTSFYEQMLLDEYYDYLDVVHFHSETHAGLWKKMAEDNNLCREIVVNYILEKSN